MDAERAAVRAANLAFYRAFEALDLAAMERVWAHDESASCLHPGWPLCAGWPAVHASWRTIFANTATMRFEVAEERIDVRGALSWVVCVERIRSTGPDGDAMIGAVIATNVFRDEGGAWKLVHHHGSPHVPERARQPPPPAPSGGRGVLN
jgi:ketosteroid isomerase-like protein